MIGEHPDLPPSLVRELHRETRARLSDWVWQKMADNAVSVFEGHMRRN